MPVYSSSLPDLPTTDVPSHATTRRILRAVFGTDAADVDIRALKLIALAYRAGRHDARWAGLTRG